MTSENVKNGTLITLTTCNIFIIHSLQLHEKEWVEITLSVFHGWKSSSSTLQLYPNLRPCIKMHDWSVSMSIPIWIFSYLLPHLSQKPSRVILFHSSTIFCLPSLFLMPVCVFYVLGEVCASVWERCVKFMV